MARKWRRDLYPAEKRVNFVQLDDRWGTIETDFVDAIAPVMNQVLDRLFSDIKRILESEDYGSLKDLKVGYKDKLVNITKQSMFEAFKLGKFEAFSEFGIKKDVTLNSDMREYFSVKADAVVNSILDKIKSDAIFTVLAGIKANKTVEQIIVDVKGPKYEGEPVAA